MKGSRRVAFVPACRGRRILLPFLMKRLFLGLMCLLLVSGFLAVFGGTGSARGEEAGDIRDAVPWPEGVTDPDEGSGFLDEGEYVLFDSSQGLYRYVSNTLRVEIVRRETKKPKRIWYEAEIWTRNDERFQALPYSYEKRMTSLAYPYRIARLHRTVFGISGDFAHLRISQKALPGILLRDGEIVSSRTGAKNRKKFPNLDTLAIFPDGSMQTYWANDLTADEYVEMGAVDVFSFGPLLIKDGELNETGIKKYGRENAQRTAIGMVEPGHFFAVMVEGRHKGSVGCSVRFIGERMFELGCTEALNLDGGQSSSIVFMGYQICKVVNSDGKVCSARRAAEIIGIGISDYVAGDDQKMSGPGQDGVLTP